MHAQGVRMGRSLSLERGHEGRIRKVPLEDRCSSMYSNYYAFFPLCLQVFTYRIAIPAFRGTDS